MNIREINDRLTGATVEEAEIVNSRYQRGLSCYPEHKGWIEVPRYTLLLTFRRHRDGKGYVPTNLFAVVPELYVEVCKEGNELEIHIK